MKITNESCGGEIAGNGICLCPVEGIINVLSKKWALVIIGTVSNHGRIRFNKILKSIKGISPKTLADRLKELEEASTKAGKHITFAIFSIISSDISIYPPRFLYGIMSYIGKFSNDFYPKFNSPPLSIIPIINNKLDRLFV